MCILLILYFMLLVYFHEVWVLKTNINIDYLLLTLRSLPITNIMCVNTDILGVFVNFCYYN